MSRDNIPPANAMVSQLSHAGKIGSFIAFVIILTFAVGLNIFHSTKEKGFGSTAKLQLQPSPFAVSTRTLHKARRNLTSPVQWPRVVLYGDSITQVSNILFWQIII